MLLAPNQHRPFSDLRKKPGSTALSPVLLSCFHIHSKTACRGFKSFCPCQKNQVSQLRYLIFFVSVRNVLATRCGCAPRTACRGGLQPCGLRPGPTEPAGENESALNAIDFFLGVLIRHHLSSPAFIPSSTQNAPDFGCFRLKSGAFSLFPPFWTRKIYGLAFVHSAT